MTTIMNTLPSAGKKVKPKTVREVLDKVLQQLQRRDQYLFFAQPVSIAEVPNYYDFIKEPMDLGTMQTKLEQGVYDSLDAFKKDFLLITGNAQYFNSLNGPSAIVHTEAKKLEDWGLKALAKEAPAVEEALAIAAAQAAVDARQKESVHLAKPKQNGPRLSLKIRANSSLISSGSATPRLSTPSGLQHEVKVEQGAPDTSLENADFEGDQQADSDDDEDDDDEDDADDDEDESDEDDDEDEDTDDDEDDLSSTNRADSMSIDGSGLGSVKRKRDGTTLKKKRRVNARRRKKGLFGRRQARNSSVVALLAIPSDRRADTQKQVLARVNTASTSVATNVPLVFRHDGSVDLEALTEDEKIAVLRSARLDSWTDVTTPSLHSLIPLHPDILPQAQSFERELRYTIDGFGAVVAHSSFPSSETYSYNLEGRGPEQQRLPFNTSSGWAYGNGNPYNIPVAWPRLMPTSSNAEEETEREGAQPGVRPPRKDRERERDEEGLAALDDWTWPRAYLTRLQDFLDVGLYTGLTPAAWALHINAQKGGPSRSRLPPFHLAAGSAFDAALLDELASLPHRALLGAKPGMIANTTLQPKPSPADVTVAIQQAADRDWMPAKPELMRMGARGTDMIREVVYGGPLGEAYASSLEDFVRGAGDYALEDDLDADDQATHAVGNINNTGVTAKDGELSHLQIGSAGGSNAPAAYFDEDGELFDQDAYIGVDLIPIEVRKEAGVVADIKANVSLQRSPSASVSDAHRGVKRSRSVSVFTPAAKRPSSATPAETRASELNDESAIDLPEVEMKEANPVQVTLDCSLLDYVRDVVLTPITHGHLHILTEISNALRAAGHKPEEGTVATVKGEVIADESPEERRRRVEEELAQRTRKIITSLLEGEQHKIRLQTHELIRAQGNAVDVDRLAGGESDLVSALKLEKEEKNFAEHGIPNPNGDLDEVLKTYAAVLEELSDTMKQAGADPAQAAKRQAKIERLRFSFIALAKRMSRLHVVIGQWTKWLDKVQKQRLDEEQRLKASQSATGASSSVTG